MQRLLANSLYFVFRVQRFAVSLITAAGKFHCGFTLALLDRRGLGHYTASVYNARKNEKHKDLFEWEREWFALHLPQKPCRILIGGAGTGREIRALAEKGYVIVAFDPAAEYVRKARKNLPEGCIEMLAGSYEDLVDSDSQGNFAKKIEQHGPYDAVILGWGSFTHISEERIRQELLRWTRKNCPRGPTLLSFWLRDRYTTVDRGKAWAMGYRLAALLTGNPGKKLPPEGDDITPHAGYGHFFTIKEIHALIEKSGYRKKEDPRIDYFHSFPHLTLIPEE